jgi:hypothetical protein
MKMAKRRDGPPLARRRFATPPLPIWERGPGAERRVIFRGGIRKGFSMFTPDCPDKIRKNISGIRSNERMTTKDKKITIELNEHDASQLLALIRREIRQVEKVWQPYWQRQAQKIERSIEHAYKQSKTYIVYMDDPY